MGYIEIDFEENEPDFDGFIPRNCYENNKEPGEDEWILQFLEDSDDEDFEGFQNDWQHEEFISRGTRPYSENGDPTYQHPEEDQPHHYFDLLWGKDLWQHLVTETNRYADQERRKNSPPPFAPK